MDDRGTTASRTGPERQRSGGALYIVSTPIGNLEDLTVRAARILTEADGVLAEDTRRTGTLLNHLGLSKRMLSLHGHNEAARGDEVLRMLEGGEELALVSDAGTPLVSDPGERLVRRVLDAGFSVVPVPGPSAILHALVGSGLPVVPFTFLGFVPRKGKARSQLLDRVAISEETCVLFESPERIGRLLTDLVKRCGDSRVAAVGRELTKLYEEFRRGTLGDLAAYYSGEGQVRGEVTLVIAPSEGESGGGRIDEEVGRALAGALLAEGLAPSRAARELARRLGLARNLAYEMVQQVQKGEGGARLPVSSDQEELET